MTGTEDIELCHLIEDEKATDPKESKKDTQQHKSRLDRLRSYRPLVAFIVFMAHLLDNVLFTAIVPILPGLLPNISNISTGTLLASKSFFQLVACFGTGPLTDRFGFTSPLLAGFLLLTSSTIVLAFVVELGKSVASRYAVILVSRSLEGIGCALTSTAGMAMIADRYPDDDERGRVIGIVLSGIGLGDVVGYPFGGAFSGIPGGVEAGWKYPFLIIAAVGLFDLVLQLLVLGYRERKRVESRANVKLSMWTLFKDPYIVLGFVVITLSQMPISATEPIVPAWMLDNFKPKPRSYSVGLVLLASTASYLVTTPLVGRVPGRHRWMGVILGMIIMTIGLSTLPLAALPRRNNIYFLIAPLLLLGVGIGMTDSLLYPIMASLVDLRHASVYGGIYAITDMAINVGYLIGPLYSAGINQLVNFNWSIWSVGIAIILSCPFIGFLKSPKSTRKCEVIENDELNE
ncbi:synaptic vesicular amine transporter-like [Oscarella lobularis]|uniref:synaptic vesicular amine transporter-like n=1 Tax=Oscarella lobularis TaxID=121494 RepID=UPI00331442D3